MEGRRFNPWWTVGAGAVANALGAGTIMVYAYGLMTVGMLAEFGWTLADASRLFTAFLLGSGIGIAVLGWMISRLGISLPSAVMAGIFGIALAAVAALPPDHTWFWITFLFVGFGGAACTAMPYAVTISGLFDKHRGLALGIVVAGSAFTAPLLPQIAQELTGTLGWRSNFIIFGLLSGTASVIGLTFFVRTPTGATLKESEAAGHATRSAFQIYFGNRYFWLIAGSILAASLAAFGGMSSLVGLFKSQNYDGRLIANIISVAAIGSLAGKLCVGYLLDRYHAPFLSSAVFAIAATGFVLLLVTSAPIGAFVGAGFIAIALGAEADILTYLISRYFPLVEFSRVVGIIWVCWAWGGGIGTSIVAASLEADQGYRAAFILFAVLLAAAAALVLLLGPYQNPRES
ncbi:MAG TPA: MFS transporter [Novosphingobium sp.]|nr:MFS transporter [Novosphingobium sp.]